MSPNEQGTIYIGAQYLFRSRDHGQSWERISPDLTTNDPEKQKQEESGRRYRGQLRRGKYTTIYSISESPRDGNTIWVGTDDGNVQLTRDGGKNWTNVVGNIPNLPKNSWVNWVEASRYDPATAYAVFDRHTFGDMDPYAYKTTDYGKTWTSILGPGSGVRGYAHVIKEDTVPPIFCSSARNSDCGFRSTAENNGRNTKDTNFPDVAVRDIVDAIPRIRSCRRHARPRHLDH